MKAINRGNRVWIIRGTDVEKGIVSSSYGDSCGIMYRVRWGRKDAAWSGITTVSHKDVFREEASACGELADRLTKLAGELRARACESLGIETKARPSASRETGGVFPHEIGNLRDC